MRTPTTPPDAPTDPGERLRRTVGQLDAGSAIVGEVARGGITSGLAAAALWWALQDDIGEVRAEVREVAQDVDRLTESQRADVARLSAEVQAVRADVMVLRVQQGPAPQR